MYDRRAWVHEPNEGSGARRQHMRASLTVFQCGSSRNRLPILPGHVHIVENGICARYACQSVSTWVVLTRTFTVLPGDTWSPTSRHKPRRPHCENRTVSSRRRANERSAKAPAQIYVFCPYDLIWPPTRRGPRQSSHKCATIWVVAFILPVQ